MKKCVLMFVLLILALVMAILTNKRIEVATNNNYVADVPQNTIRMATAPSQE